MTKTGIQQVASVNTRKKKVLIGNGNNPVNAIPHFCLTVFLNGAKSAGM